MNTLARRLIADESGATAIEYGLILALLALAILIAITAIGARLSTKFTLISTRLS